MHYKDVKCSKHEMVINTVYFYCKLVQNNISEVTKLIAYSNKECFWLFWVGHFD